MNEERQAYRIRQALNHGLQDIAPASARRLEAARHLALARQKQGEVETLLATSNGFSLTTLLGRGMLHAGLRQGLAILGLLIGMWTSFYWHSEQYVAEIAATDSALLTDDLPPDVLQDNEFLAWLIDDTAEDELSQE